MVSTTEIPNAILNTKIVDGFIGIEKYPIIAAVSSSGIRFGIKETITILEERNIQAIKIEIRKITSSKLYAKFPT